MSSKSRSRSKKKTDDNLTDDTMDVEENKDQTPGNPGDQTPPDTGEHFNDDPPQHRQQTPQQVPLSTSSIPAAHTSTLLSVHPPAVTGQVLGRELTGAAAVGGAVPTVDQSHDQIINPTGILNVGGAGGAVGTGGAGGNNGTGIGNQLNPIQPYQQYIPPPLQAQLPPIPPQFQMNIGGNGIAGQVPAGNYQNNFSGGNQGYNNYYPNGQQPGGNYQYPPYPQYYPPHMYPPQQVVPPQPSVPALINYSSVKFISDSAKLDIKLKEREWTKYARDLKLQLGILDAADFINLDSETHWKKIVKQYPNAANLSHIYGKFRSAHGILYNLLIQSISKLVQSTDNIVSRIKEDYNRENGHNSADTDEAETGGINGTLTGTFCNSNVYLLFQELKRRYSQSENTSAYYIAKLEKLIQMKMNPGESMQSFESRFLTLVAEINRIRDIEQPKDGNIFTDTLIAGFALRAITDSKYTSMKTRLQESDRLVPSEVFSKLNTIDINSKATPQPQNNSSAHHTRDTRSDGEEETSDQANYAGGSVDRSRNKHQRGGGTSNRGGHKGRYHDKSNQQKKQEAGGTDTDSTGYKAPAGLEGLLDGMKYKPGGTRTISSNCCVDASSDDSDDYYSDTEQANAVTSSSTATNSSTLRDGIGKYSDISERYTFLFDTGSTRNITCNVTLLSDYEKLETPLYIRGLGKQKHMLVGTGTLKLNDNVKIKNVYYCPSGGVNLISGAEILESGLHFGAAIGTDNHLVLMNKSSKPLIAFRNHDGLFKYTHSNWKEISSHIQSKVTDPSRSKSKQHSRPSPAPTTGDKVRQTDKDKSTPAPTRHIPKKTTPTTSTATSNSSTPATNTTASNSSSTSSSRTRSAAANFAYTIKDSEADSDFESCDGDGEDSDNDSDAGSESGTGTSDIDDDFSGTVINDTVGTPTIIRVEHSVMHKRLNHTKLTPPIIKELLNSGMKITGKEQYCETCAATKIRRKPTGSGAYVKPTKPFERLDIDVAGPYSVVNPITKQRTSLPSLGGNHYELLVVDHCARYDWNYHLGHKGEAPLKVIELLDFIETQHGTRVKHLHSDGAPELIAGILKDYCVKKGIKQTFGPTNTPHLNGTVERMIGKLTTAVRSMLKAANLRPTLWAEAYDAATYAHNRTPLKQLGYKTPFEIINGYPDASGIKKINTFGSSVQYMLQEKEASKFTKAKPGILLSRETNRLSYRILTGTGTVIHARDVKINDNDFSHVELLNFNDEEEQFYGMGDDMDDHNDDDYSDEGVPVSDSGDETPDTVKTPRNRNRSPPPQNVGTHSPSPSSSPPLIKVEEPVIAADPVELEDTGGDNIETEFDDYDVEVNGGEYDDMDEFDHDYSSEHKEHEVYDESSGIDAEDNTNSIEAGGDSSEEESTVTRQEVPPEPVITRSGRISKPNTEWWKANTATGVNQSPVEFAAATSTASSNTGSETAAGTTVPNYNIVNPLSDVIDISSFLPNDDTAGEQLTEQISEESEPATYRAAMKTRDYEKWKTSIKEEIDSLLLNNVLKLVPRPKDKKKHLLTTKWVFKLKRNEHNEIVRYKSRLVVHGYKQKEEDFFETYAPVAYFKSVKAMLSLAAIYNLELNQIDFKTAFLNADIDTELFITIPDGLKEGVDTTKYCYVLNKALYGLKQAPHLWAMMLREILFKHGYRNTGSDNCIYYKHVAGHRHPIIISTYVDDLIVLFPESLRSIWLEDKAKIAAECAIDDMGELHYCLKMLVLRDRDTGTITVDQVAYIEALLHQFDIDVNNTTGTDNPGLSSSLTNPTAILAGTPLDAENHHLYRQIVGKLSYLANTTRSDISYTVNLLARFVNAPTNIHMKHARHLLRYLVTTKNYQLTFKSSDATAGGDKKIVSTSTGTLKLYGYSDADYNSDAVTRRSTFGYIVYLNGNPIHWASKRQKSVSLSSTEAEYIGVNNLAREIVWFQELLYDIYGIHLNSTIYSDNQACIAWCCGENIAHQTSKHLDICYKYIRQLVRVEKRIDMKWVATKYMVADILTKYIPTVTFTFLRDLFFKITDPVQVPPQVTA